LRLDAIVQLSVVSATTSAQPGSPTDGLVYILPAGKTGAAWGAMANNALAYWRDGAWEQITPREGWLAYVRDTDQLRVYDGSVWSQSVARAALGLGSAATASLGTGGAAVPLLSTANDWGGFQFFNGGFSIQNAAPFFSFYESDAPLDEKYWLIQVNGGDMVWTAPKDDISAASSWMVVTRTGHTGVDVNFAQASVKIGGRACFTAARARCRSPTTLTTSAQRPFALVRSSPRQARSTRPTAAKRRRSAPFPKASSARCAA
jgi:hypothetical protein